MERDELLVFIKKKQNASALETEQGQCKSWIWAALDVPTRLMAHFIIGDLAVGQNLESMKVLRAQMSKRKPLFVSDELPHHSPALAQKYSTVVIPSRTGKRGRPRSPQRIIDPDLGCAKVQKTCSK